MKIAIASGKGGVGKSMLASSLAMLLAEEKKVVAVDGDVDAPNLHLWLGERERWDEVEKISVSEKPVVNQKKCNLCGRCLEVCAFKALSISHQLLTVNHFFCEGCAACEVICPLKAITMRPVKNAEIRIKKNIQGFPLVSAQLFPGETGSGKIVDQIKKRAEGFKYEVMVIDSPAGTGCPVIAALNGADFIILITEPTPSGFSDIKRVLMVVDHFKIPYGVVINKWNANPAGSNQIEGWAKNRLLGKIAYDKRLFQAIAELKPVMKTNLPAKKEIEEIYRSLSGVALKSRLG